MSPRIELQPVDVKQRGIRADQWNDAPPALSNHDQVPGDSSGKLREEGSDKSRRKLRSHCNAIVIHKIGIVDRKIVTAIQEGFGERDEGTLPHIVGSGFEAQSDQQNA
jgi:hypothetical protein